MLSIPHPMFLVTSYKANGLANACMQSWAAFTSADGGRGFYALLSSVHKGGHLYGTLHGKGAAVINFFAPELYDRCMATIAHNGFEEDELAVAGLTAVPAARVDAPMAGECFMNLECRFAWEKELVPGDDHALICLEVVCAHVDEERLDEERAGRYGEGGFAYNIHHPIDPYRFPGTARDYIGILKKYRDTGEY